MDLNDRDTLIKLLDQALSSKEESVKSLLQSLLVTTALVHAEDEEPIRGPLTELLEIVYDIQAAIGGIQANIDSLKGKVRELESNSSNPKTLTPKSKIKDRWVPEYSYSDKWKKIRDENNTDTYEDISTDYVDIIKNIMNRLGN